MAIFFSSCLLGRCPPRIYFRPCHLSARFLASLFKLLVLCVTVPHGRRHGNRLALILPCPRPEWFPSDHGQRRWPNGEGIEIFCEEDDGSLKKGDLTATSAVFT